MSGTTPDPSDDPQDEREVTRRREGEHRAGVPERRDESEVRAGETEPGLEGIDALPEADEDPTSG